MIEHVWKSNGIIQFNITVVHGIFFKKQHIIDLQKLVYLERMFVHITSMLFT